MEVDHIKPLYLFGLTALSNLQLLCSICNKWKGVKWIDFRANWVNGRWVRIVLLAFRFLSDVVRPAVSP